MCSRVGCCSPFQSLPLRPIPVEASRRPCMTLHPYTSAGVIPASQVLGQPPIHVSRPASEAGLSNFAREAQRMDGALNGINPRNIIALAQTKEDPSMTLEKGPIASANRCSVPECKCPNRLVQHLNSIIQLTFTVV